MPDNPMLVRAVDILLVEDSAADVRLTREALRNTKLINRLTVAGDGVEAMTFLRKQGRHAEACRPDLILLDLNLPRKNGRAVLEEIKQDPDLKRIPVVIITSSTAEEDVAQLQPARELLRDQAAGAAEFRAGGASDRGFLDGDRQAAAEVNGRARCRSKPCWWRTARPTPARSRSF